MPRKSVAEWQAEAEALQVQLTAQQEKWDNLWSDLGQEANRREWCDVYDQFAEAHGGPERPQPKARKFTVTVEYEVTATPTSPGAESKADDEQFIRDSIRNYQLEAGFALDSDWEDVSVGMGFTISSVEVAE